MKNYCGKKIFANCIRGFEAVGGRIHFDEAGMTFHSHSFNIQKGDTRIAYREIIRLKKRNTLGIVPNGISIITRDGTEHKFVIYHRTKVIAYLTSKMHE